METYSRQLIQSQETTGAFKNADGQDSAFFTALILSCLNRLSKTPALESAKKRATQWLLTRKDDNWIWSESSGADFLILAALAEYDPKLIDGVGLAKILLRLTSLESQEGGPYYSYANDKDKSIDLGVNAAIAYFLSLQNVNLPELDKLIESAIQNEDFHSEFFASEYPIIYLIAKFYEGDQKQKLISCLLNKKQGGGWDNVMHGALAVSALRQLGYEEEKIETETACLEKSAGELNSNYAFYTGENRRMTSVPALNIAFYLEALSKIEQTSKKETVKDEGGRTTVYDEQEKLVLEKIIEAAKQRFSGLSYELKNLALGEIQKTIKGNFDKQMSLMAYYTRQALGEKGKKFSDELVAELGLANIFFWTAFIIYDDFWDEDEAANPRLLPTANLLARNYVDFFSSFLSAQTGFRDFFRELMDGLDAANTWETIHCRAKIQGSKFIIPASLPDYDDYDLKYRPASGHILGPTAMLVHLGYGLDSAETQNLISYFKNYLIAMQLNDDTHDWQEDMQRGHLSPVVTMMVRDWQNKYPDKKEIDLEKDLEELRQIFWFKTIVQVCETAILRTEKSRQALRAMTILENPAPLAHFIDITENVARKALDEQKKSTDFLREFKS